MQTTVDAAGGCRDTAARIARRCWMYAEQGADKEQVLQFRGEQYGKVARCAAGQMVLLDMLGNGSKAKKSAGKPSPPRPRAPIAPAKEAGEDDDEDAPPDSLAHSKLHWQPQSGTFWFEVDREGGDRVRCQTTIQAAGGCRETAARIGRLVYAFIERGASREQALQYRAEQYQKCQMHSARRLGLTDVRDLFRKVHGDIAADSPQSGATPAAPKSAEAVPARAAKRMALSQKPGPQPRQRAELFRNLRGEVVSVSSSPICQKAPVKPWAELEPSDVDQLSENHIYFYEKELNLSFRRSLEERIARVAQMAQRTTLTLCGKPKNSENQGTALEDALASMEESASSEDARNFDAQFLQVFLALDPSERMSATASEVSILERVAHIEDGYKYTVPERRNRLKERLWEMRSASGPMKKDKGFLQTWAKPAASGSAA